MSWLLAPLYDTFMKNTEAHCLGQWRQTLLRQAVGRVLEIGGGTGVNLQYYPEAATQVIVTEPDLGMKKQLDHKFEALGKIHFETVQAKAEDLSQGPRVSAKGMTPQGTKPFARLPGHQSQRLSLPMAASSRVQ